MPDLEHQLLTAWPVDRWQDVGLLIAVSGGPDSVALLRALDRLHPATDRRLYVAHYNHGWRGQASDADARFVEDLARSLRIECVTGTVDVGTSNLAPDGLEAAAREARYRFLVDTAERLGCRYVATGHTADDQAETILHHIVRGTGLLGLAGMRPARTLSPMVTLIRPLLAVSRAEVIEYLAGLEQPYREDATNADRDLTRNRIRHELLPLLARDYAPGVIDSLRRLGAIAADAQEILEPLAESLLDEATTESSAQSLVLRCEPLQSSHRHLVRELFLVAWRRLAWPRQAMGMQHWQQLAELAQQSGESPAQMLPGAVRVERTADLLILTRTELPGPRADHA